jgi:hypothetical protein
MGQVFIVSRVAAVNDTLRADFNNVVGNRLDEFVIMGREDNGALKVDQAVVQCGD